PLTDIEDTLNPYRVRAQITTSSSLFTDSTLVFYKINSSDFTTIPLSAEIDTPGIYAGYIPAQSGGDTVHYYLLIKNADGIRRTSPINVPVHIYSFIVGSNVITEENITSVKVRHRFSVFPNPTQRELTFSVSLLERTYLRIEIYNVLGQEVKVIIDKTLKSGNYDIQWDFYDDRNQELAQGAYFYRIITDKEVKTGKILLIK
ncbi:MAG: T9SS type A sorting domain-containing protein, partial [bacterium]